MKALKERWIVSDAERLMVEQQETLALAERREADAREHVETRVALQIAAQDVHAQNRIVDEVRRGWEIYQEATSKQRDDLRRTFKASAAGKLTLRRLGIDVSGDFSETMFERYPDLRDGFAGFVYNKARAAKGRAR